MVDVDHHLRDARVEVERLDVFAEFANRLVHERFGFGVAGDVADVVLEDVFVLRDDEAPAFGEESVDALDALGIPRFDLVEGAHEHFVESQGVGAEVADDVVGVDDVFERFRHFSGNLGELFACLFAEVFAVFGDDLVVGHECAAGVFVRQAEDHALVEELFERLFRVDEPDIVEDFVPESRVEQVQDGVFGAPDVEIDGHPVFFVGCAKWSRVVVGVDVAQVIPA